MVLKDTLATFVYLTGSSFLARCFRQQYIHLILLYFEIQAYERLEHWSCVLLGTHRTSPTFFYIFSSRHLTWKLRLGERSRRLASRKWPPLLRLLLRSLRTRTRAVVTCRCAPNAHIKKSLHLSDTVLTNVPYFSGGKL